MPSLNSRFALACFVAGGAGALTVSPPARADVDPGYFINGRRVERAEFEADQARVRARRIGPRAESCQSTGPQNIAVFLVKATDAPLTPGMPTPASVEKAYFDNGPALSIRDVYREYSYGKLDLRGKVFGWMTVPRHDDLFAWADRALEQANRTGGWDPRLYPRVVMMMPESFRAYASYCQYARSFLRPNTGEWVNWTGSLAFVPAGDFNVDPRKSQLFTAVHELGHNFDVHHAESLRSFEGAPGDPAAGYVETPLPPPGQPWRAYREYDDAYSSMGCCSLGHFAGNQKRKLGWLVPEANAGGSVPYFRDVAAGQSGTFALNAYESPAPGAAALRIEREPGASWLWLEYRRKRGSRLNGGLSDDSLVIHYEGDPDYRAGNGVVRLGRGEVDDWSYLVDFSPGDGSMYPAALPWDRPWSDPSGGDLTLRATRDAATGQARVEVVRGGGGACGLTPPLATLTATSDTLLRRRDGRDVLTLRNVDAPGCPARTFTVGATVDAPWRVGLTEFAAGSPIGELRLKPGQTGIARVAVNPGEEFESRTVAATAVDRARPALAARVESPHVPTDVDARLEIAPVETGWSDGRSHYTVRATVTLVRKVRGQEPGAPIVGAHVPFLFSGPAPESSGWGSAVTGADGRATHAFTVLDDRSYPVRYYGQSVVTASGDVGGDGGRFSVRGTFEVQP